MVGPWCWNAKKNRYYLYPPVFYDLEAASEHKQLSLRKFRRKNNQFWPGGVKGHLSSVWKVGFYSQAERAKEHFTQWEQHEQKPVRGQLLGMFGESGKKTLRVWEVSFNGWWDVKGSSPLMSNLGTQVRLCRQWESLSFVCVQGYQPNHV